MNCIRFVCCTILVLVSLQQGCTGQDLSSAENSLQQTTSCSSDSIRLMTFNTQFLPWIVTKNPARLDQIRAGKFAQAIAQAQVDVVALTEVFDEDAREAFVARMPAYGFRYYVSKIDEDDLEDSGLMLFSKYPFTTLPNPVHRYTDMEGHNQGIGWDLGFIPYECLGGTSDCYVGKGVGLVRILHPCDGRPINVAFSHLQASYTSEEVETLWRRGTSAAVRQGQMQQIQRIIEDSLGRHALRREEVFVLGDLNIDGNRVDPSNVRQLHGVKEWRYHFDPSVNPAGFFSSTLRDGWYYGTSPQDLGRTAGDGFPEFSVPLKGERLDYVLHNHPVVNDYPRCLQHIRKGWELIESSNGVAISDHHAVVADFNRSGPYCSPRSAKPIFGSQFGSLSTPGAMQWYRIEQPGTYSLGIQSGAPVVYDVYEATDLSRPLRAFSTEVNDWGTKYLLPKPPYYVRVHSKNPDATGGYKLLVHRHQGSSRQDALALVPEEASHHQFTPALLSIGNAMWFELLSQEGEMGTFRYPRVKAVLAHTAGRPFTVNLLTSDGSLVTWSRPTASTDGILSSYQRILSTRLPAGKYFLKVTPLFSSPAYHTFDIMYLTTLSYFVPKQLHCITQTDDVGDDETYANATVDGVPTRDRKIGDFDSDEIRDLTYNVIPKLRFVDEYRLQLWENDDGNSHDYFSPLVLDAGGPASNTTVKRWSQHTGEYKLTYYFGHRPEPKLKTQGL